MAEMRRILVGGKHVEYPMEWWQALEGTDDEGTRWWPDKWGGSDGCSFFFDHVGPWDLRPACQIHDWHYTGHSYLGGTWKSRREADDIAVRNARRLVEFQGGPVGELEPAFSVARDLLRAAGWARFDYSESGIWLSRAREATEVARVGGKIARVLGSGRLIQQVS